MGAPALHDAITDVPGLRVGHWTDARGRTGCTVLLCPPGTVGGVDVRGGAPGTRETDLLRPGNLVSEVHAVLLTGGSAFGLDAATGVVRWLEERGIGFDVRVARVPIVPAAVIFDLGVGDPKARPDAAAGYAACERATGGPVPSGPVGAGTGATVGKLLGPQFASRGGLGTASLRVGAEVVGALAVVNAFGDVVDPATGKILAGTRRPLVGGFLDTNAQLRSGLGQLFQAAAGESTTIAVVATTARLDKAQLGRVALMAHDGLARTIRPVHTQLDGDTVFALSCPSPEATAGDVTVIGAAAADALALAVVRAVTAGGGG